MKYFAKSSLAIVAWSALAATAMAHDPELEISSAWARATAPDATKGGAYLLIKNPSDQEDRLLMFSSDKARVHEIHEHVHKDGMMVMQEIEGGAVIPAGETAVFKPMANHLMFIDLIEPLVAGEHFTVTLTFEHQGDMDVSFPVLSPVEAQKMMEMPMPNSSDMPAMNHGDMDHSKMNQNHSTAEAPKS